MADKKPVVPPEEFDKMIRTRTDHWAKDVEGGERYRTALGVTLHRREQNDYHGFWDRQLNAYLEVPSEGLMKWPVIGQVIWTHCNDWLSTRVQLEITSDSSDPMNMGGDRVAQSLFEKIYSTLWTDMEEYKMALYSQCSFNWFGVSGCTARKARSSMKVPTVVKDSIDTDEPEYSCAECGASGPAVNLATEKGADLSQKQKCPNCGKMAAYVDSPTGDKKEVEVQGEYKEAPEVDNFFGVYPSFLFRVDEVNGKGADLRPCRFVNMNRLARRYELRELYGEDVTDGLDTSDGKSWTEPVKWWHALQSGSIATIKDSQKGKQGENADDDLLQESIWWISPAAVANWKAPADFEVSKKCPFKIKKGQTIAEALGKKKFVGLYIVLCGKKVLWVDNESHNEVLVAGLWLMNGASFWGKGQQELNDIQEAANAFFTLFYEYGTHASVPHRVVDPAIFDKKDFKNRAGGISYTKKGAARNHPIRWYWEDLQPARLSPDLYQLWALLVQEGKEDIGRAPKASVGQGDAKNRTFGGQQLLTQRGLSSLIPSQKSKGAALKLFAKQHLSFIQRYWSNDQIRRVLVKRDQSWEDQDIEAFRNLDLERDLSYEIVEGSDIPVTYAEKEQRLGQAIMSGVLWNPDIPVDLRVQFAKFARIDYDPDNVERERRHQTQVLKKIKDACAYMERHAQGYIITAESGTEVNPQVVNQILTLPGVEILVQTENLQYAATFFNNEIIAQHTAEHPDQLLLSVLTERIKQLSQAIQQSDITQAQVMGAAKSQIEAQQSADKDKQLQAEAEKQRKDQEFQMMKQKDDQQFKFQLEQMKLASQGQQEVADKIPNL